MRNSVILSHVDHTLLTADASWDDIQRLCNEAVAFKTAAVCVPSSTVKKIRETYGDKLTVCAAVDLSVDNALAALHNGADELELMIPLGEIQSNGLAAAHKMAAIQKLAGSKIIKVFCETRCLSPAEKISLCRYAAESGVAYVSIAAEDVPFIQAHIGTNGKIKANGAFRSKDALAALLVSGCHRLGTGAAIKIILGEFFDS